MSYENIIVELIVKGGDARSNALLAIRAAREEDFAKAEKLIQECNRLLVEAHEIQTDMIQEELNAEEKRAVDLLMVHGQDHLMNAMTVRDLAVEIIELCKMRHADKEGEA